MQIAFYDIPHNEKWITKSEISIGTVVFIWLIHFSLYRKKVIFISSLLSYVISFTLNVLCWCNGFL